MMRYFISLYGLSWTMIFLLSLVQPFRGIVHGHDIVSGMVERGGWTLTFTATHGMCQREVVLMTVTDEAKTYLLNPAARPYPGVSMIDHLTGGIVGSWSKVPLEDARIGYIGKLEGTKGRGTWWSAFGCRGVWYGERMEA